VGNFSGGKFAVDGRNPHNSRIFLCTFSKIFDPIHAEKVICIGIVFMLSFCKYVTYGQENQVFSVLN
jgi:hypothetical protein